MRLTGASAEYLYRSAAPVGIVGRFSYGSAPLLGQRLATGEGGVALNTVVSHLSPFCEGLAGIAYTRSNDLQYLYQGPKAGFTMSAAGGLDYHSQRRWGLRLLRVEVQHLAFGVQGRSSLYWNVETGAVFSFRSAATRD